MSLAPDIPSTGGSSSRRVVVGYLSVSTLFTLASSLIWAVNTIFLLRNGGLSLFEVMIVNATFTVGQMVFEVPTGVVADTIGRRASLLLGMATLLIATLLYVLVPVWGWGIWGFIGASVLIGFGFTCMTGALEAWLVDALDATEWEGPKDRVFAWGQMATSVGMLAGSLMGGIFGQIGLSIPYLIRAGLLAVAFLVTALLVRDLGFTPRPLKVSTLGAETQSILRASVSYGWRSRVIRPLLWASGLNGTVFIFAFYSLQPYILDLLGRNYVWLLGVVTAAFSLMGIVGSALVKRVMREGVLRREPTRVLQVTSGVTALLAFGIAAVGLVSSRPGFLPATIVIVLWLAWGLLFGIGRPVRQSYLNDHIPSAQRATVLSLDAFFEDAGGAVGQPGLGWISERPSIPVAWLVGGALLLGVPLLYRSSGNGARETAGAEQRVAAVH